MLILDVGSHRAQSRDERTPIIAETSARDDVRNQIRWKNQISKRPHNHALSPTRRIAILQAIEQS